MKGLYLTLLIGAVLLGTGCKSKPKDGRVRPPVDELYDEGRGLQGKDVIASSDKMAASLLSLPQLNASDRQWTIVVDRVENLTQSQRGDLNIFLMRLRSKLLQMGGGRVTLIENMQKFNDLRNRELEPGSDRFGQTGLDQKPRTVQPDYFLSAKLAELPNRETSYFLVEFTLTKVDRTIVWSDMYEIATKR